MTFQKGQSGNPTGRKPGIKDKRVLMWEKLGQYLIGEGAEKYLDILSKQSDKNFILAYNQILDYFKPKLQRTTVAGDEDQPLTIQDARKELLEKLTTLSNGNGKAETNGKVK